ncbi:DNA-directed RNA polymerase III subunit Rpc5 [Abortiporus biennis]
MDLQPEEDQLIAVLPVHFSDALTPNIHLHQFPLLTRPLQVPPSAAASGKRIKARLKPGVRRLEIHVPVDTRPEVWNPERSRELGSARNVDDREKNQESVPIGKQKEGEDPRLTEVRMRSEQVPLSGAYTLGIVRDGKLFLHPINEMHQLRPTLTYMDILTRKTKRKGAGSDDDSDDGPPPDPDDPTPTVAAPKKEKKPVGEAKEIHVALKKTIDDKGLPMGGGMTAVRRDMLMAIRAEEDETWDDYTFCDAETEESGEAFGKVFAHNTELLECKTNFTSLLKDIKGL